MSNWFRRAAFRAKSYVQRCSESFFSDANGKRICESEFFFSAGMSNLSRPMIESEASGGRFITQNKNFSCSPFAIPHQLMKHGRMCPLPPFSIPSMLFSTSTEGLDSSDGPEATVSSPLFMGGKAIPKKGEDKEQPKIVQAVLSGFRQSPKKVNLVAALVRGMRVQDALIQMQVSKKRAAKVIFKLITAARANASYNHGLDKDKLIIAEAFVGKGIYLKRIFPHAKGRSGVMHRPHSNITVKVREMTEMEQKKWKKDLANQRHVKHPTKLAPHRIIERKIIRESNDSVDA